MLHVEANGRWQASSLNCSIPAHRGLLRGDGGCEVAVRPDGPEARDPSQLRSVLLVDDDEVFVDLLARFFRVAGYAPSVAHTGTEALELLSSRPFAAIVADLKLPDIEGIEILTRVRVAIGDVPFIMISGHGSIDVATRAMKLGATDFLSKPLLIDELLRKVDRYVRFEDSEEHQSGTRNVVRSGGYNELSTAIARIGITAVTTRAFTHEAQACLAVRIRRQLVVLLLGACTRFDLPLEEWCACAEGGKRVNAAGNGLSADDLVRLAEDVLHHWPAAQVKDPRVLQALAVLGVNDGSGLQLLEGTVAKRLAIDPAHLGRLIHADTGLTFSDARRACRLRYAAHALATTNEHVRQIAYGSGFGDPSQFDHEFHRAFGVCPSDFRKMLSVGAVHH